MIKVKTTIFFCLAIIFFSCAQGNQTSNETTLKNDKFFFDESLEASTNDDVNLENIKKLIVSILNSAGFFWKNGQLLPFTVLENKGIDNARARIRYHIKERKDKDPKLRFIKRIIEYNPIFLNNMTSQSDTQKWISKYVFAHEVGHHLMGHLLDRLKERKQEEIEADTYAGFILQRMGADSSEVLLGIKALEVKDDPKEEYPPKSKRISAVRNGWRQAKQLGKMSCEMQHKISSTSTIDSYMLKNSEAFGFDFTPMPQDYISSPFVYQDTKEIRLAALKKERVETLIEKYTQQVEINRLEVQNAESFAYAITNFSDLRENRKFKREFSDYQELLNQSKQTEQNISLNVENVNDRLAWIIQSASEDNSPLGDTNIENTATYFRALSVWSNADTFTDLTIENLEEQQESVAEVFESVKNDKNKNLDLSDFYSLEFEINRKNNQLQLIEQRLATISADSTLLENSRAVKTIDEQALENFKKEEFIGQLLFSGHSNLYLISKAGELFLLNQNGDLSKALGQKMISNKPTFSFYCQLNQRLYAIDQENRIWTWFPNGFPFQTGIYKPL